MIARFGLAASLGQLQAQTLFLHMIGISSLQYPSTNTELVSNISPPSSPSLMIGPLCGVPATLQMFLALD